MLDGWRRAGSPWRRALEAELPEATGFSAPVVAEGLRLGLASWSGEKLLELVAREIGPEDRLDAAGASMVSGFDTTAVFLAGAIPMPTLLALVAPLALRSPVLAKVASRDPVTARHVARSIAECDPLLGQCVDCVEFARRGWRQRGAPCSRPTASSPPDPTRRWRPSARACARRGAS